MKEDLKEILNTVLDNNGLDTIEEIKTGIHLRNDLELDSINLAELTVRIEEKFGVDVFQDGIVETLDEIMAILENSVLNN